MQAEEKQQKQMNGSSIHRVAAAPLTEANAFAGLGRPNVVPTDCYELVIQTLGEQTLRRNTLFVTSVGAGEGATTTAVNLAVVLSRGELPVLLVELRLTEPRLVRMLGNPQEVVGLEIGLRGEVPLDDCIFFVGDEKLQIMALRQAFTYEEAIHQSGALNDFLVWTESRFSWVIFDCPPVSSADWSRWFALNADPALLVVRANQTSVRAVQRAAHSLRDHLAGAILNDDQAA